MAESEEPEQRAPSLIILKRMLARGKSIARERGHSVVGTDDLLLALLIDVDTPVGQLMEQHGADYDSVKLQLAASQPRYGPQPQSRRPHSIRVGNRKLGFTVALGLLKSMRGIASREAADDHEGALAHGQQLDALAERSGISTLRAFAHVQVGSSNLALGRLNPAHNAFAAAAALHSAPTVTWSVFAPKIDPIEVVDDALYGLCEVADQRNDADKSAEIAALEHLREFRTQYGSDETAAWTAERLARIHAVNEDFATAARWGEIAVEEYRRAGAAEGAANAARSVAESYRRSGNPERGLAAAEQAIEGAVVACNKAPEVSARFERARANRALGKPTEAWQEFSSAPAR
ncbi:Clp protease N-terminal domain-containing protein [Mycobacterium deserti]|uniref:Clp R domain-containing protein n=1 Tax=Mycobacterium deserti TaxID=2978347 RepID=A0ABT2M6Z2_9MYCO|nr:Clp protease N-terminal domain-containing protein [Mycobacterium deserti]MCT7658033.1 hypothetical protein [Mycobacterium deserti]